MKVILTKCMMNPLHYYNMQWLKKHCILNKETGNMCVPDSIGEAVVLQACAYQD